MSEYVTFIPNAGVCVLSKNILEKKGNLRWCIREESLNDMDNSWRFYQMLKQMNIWVMRIICVSVILIQLQT